MKSLMKDMFTEFKNS
jgi:hypothetical protein